MRSPWAESWLRTGSVRAYRWLLHRYPTTLRARFGVDMIDAFTRLLDEGWERGGVRGVCGVWVRILRDLIRPLPTTGAPAGLEGATWAGAGRAMVGETAASMRRCVRHPVFSLLVVGVSAVGIGASLTAWTVLDAYVLRPLPYPEADRLVRLRPVSDQVTPKTSEDLFERAVSWDLDGFTLVGDPTAEVVLGAHVGAEFAELFGVRPTVGRFFTVAEATQEHPVVVIGHDLWVRRFGEDPEIVGRSLTFLEGSTRRTAEIIGVLPEAFWYLNGYTELLLPLSADAPIQVGRLAPGLTPRSAEERIAERFGETADGRVGVTSLQRAYTARARPRVVLFQVTAILLLGVALANAILLMVLRASERAPERRLRLALGAGRLRMYMGLLLDAAGLAAASALIGFGLATGLLGGITAGLAGVLGASVPGGAETMQVGWGLAGMAGALGAVFMLGLAVVPALLFRTGPGNRLPTASGFRTTGGVQGRRIRGTLVAAELALSTTLLAGGVLTLHSVVRMTGADPGFQTEGLGVFTVGLTGPRYETEARRRAFFETWQARMSARPDVAAAGLVRGAPFVSDLTQRRVVARVQTDATALTTTGLDAVPQIATASFFEVIGVPFLVGSASAFAEAGGPPVAVVSRRFAMGVWPRRPLDQVVGRAFRFEAWQMPEMVEEPGPWTTVVGVVDDIRDASNGSTPVAYVPYVQAPSGWMDLVVRTARGGSVTAGEARAVLRGLDPDVPLYATASVSDAIDRTRAPIRFTAALLACFSLATFALVVLGVYGVTAWAARQARRSVAIRVALGAAPAEVGLSFVGGMLPWFGSGLVVGMGGGWLLNQALEVQLGHATPGMGLAPLALAVGALAVTALLATWLPARRVAGIDPMAVFGGR